MSATMINVLFAIIIVICALYIWANETRKRSLKKIRINKKRKAQIQLKNDLEYFVSQLNTAQTLNEIFILHIQLWARGIRNANIGPDQFGMFRTSDILLMKKKEVFLGNIWGLVTKPLSYWETCEDENSVKLVTNQYKDQLLSNLKATYNELIHD